MTAPNLLACGQLSIERFAIARGKPWKSSSNFSGFAHTTSSNDYSLLNLGKLGIGGQGIKLQHKDGEKYQYCKTK